MVTNASLLDEMLKDQKVATMPEPVTTSATKAVLSKGSNLAMGVDRTKDDIEYLRDNKDEGTRRTLGTTSATTSLTATGTKVAQKGVEKGTEVLANKILSGNTTRNITDVTRIAKVGANLGNVASGLGAVASVAGFGKQLHDEIAQVSALNTGRGFESAGEKVVRGTSLVSSGVTAAAAVGSTVAAVTGSVAAANFWNPIGWVAAGVGLVTAGVSYLTNQSKIAGTKFKSKFKPGAYLGRRI
jgi:hypothetical protein